MLWTSTAQGQAAKDTAAQVAGQADTATLSPFVQRIIIAANKDRTKSDSAFKAGRTANMQRLIWNELISTAREVKIYLSSTHDPAYYKKSIEAASKSYDIVRDGVFINKGTTQAERNLSVSSVVLLRLLNDMKAKKAQIDNYSANLNRFRSKMDSLLSDPVIYSFPTDSIALSKYLDRLRVIVKEGDPADNALNKALSDIEEIQNQADGLLFRLNVSYEEVESLRNELANISLKRELPNIWNAPGRYRPFEEIIRFSYAKEKMAFQFYLRDNISTIWGLAFLVVILYYVQRIVSKKIHLKANDPEHSNKLIVRHPFACAVFIALCLGQFFFITAPFIFSICIWFIEVCCLIIFARNFITAYWLRFWITISALFLMACADNLILQASRTERWLMAGLALTGVVYGIMLLFSKHRGALKEKTILIFIRFLVVAETLSLLLNILGRYNLSKILLNVGYTGLNVAIIFIWVIRLLGELLGLGSKLYEDGAKPAFLKTSEIGDKAPALFYGLFGFAWLVIVGRQFYVFKRVAEPFQNFLYHERTIGSYSFSINGIFLFIVIMLCSMALSRIITVIADYGQSSHNASRDQKKSSGGSWILLARIVIISVGVFLAFAASGLPLDRLTIVLGALGVGIGLGLQSLVSNLVSGLIIAFEKPINVGDLVELGGKTGYVRSLGFRSSIVALTDGASLVVPNGDILNNHVVNWSLSQSVKRLTIAVSVAYGSNLEQVKLLLEGIAFGDSRALSLPAPFAAAKKFGDSAIDFELIFWTRIADEAIVRNDIITSIDKVFKEKGIIIPFPQTELHWVRPEA